MTHARVCAIGLRAGCQLQHRRPRASAVGAGGDREDGLAAVAGTAFTYGAVIAVYPCAVNKLFGENRYPAAYGWMFTAWGTAGLVGPIGAGLLFEAVGSYGLPLLLAAMAAIGSAHLTRPLPTELRESGP